MLSGYSKGLLQPALESSLLDFRGTFQQGLVYIIAMFWQTVGMLSLGILLRAAKKLVQTGLLQCPDRGHPAGI